MTRLVHALLVLAACGESRSSTPAPGSTSTPPALETTPNSKRLCARLDLAALAGALEIGELTRTGRGSLSTGGGAPPTLACSYFEAGKVDGGLGFGFTLTATAELEDRDPFNRFEWAPFDGLGRPAQIGRAETKRSVHVQTVVNGVLLIADVTHPGLAIPELERRLVAVTQHVIARLPADASIEIR